MKKYLIILFAVGCLFAIGQNVYAAGTAVFGVNTTLYNDNACGATYPTTDTGGNTTWTDGILSTARTIGAGDCVYGSFGTLKRIDGWWVRMINTQTTPRAGTLRIFDINKNLVGSHSGLFYNNSTINEVTTPISGYYFTIKNDTSFSLSTLEIQLYETPDTIPPSVPTLNAVGGNQSVNLSWTKPTDVDLAGYKIYRNNALIQTINNANTLTFTNTGLTAGTQYSFQISSYDLTGNESNRSTTVFATATDTAAPTTPTNVNATPGDKRITISWTASTDNTGVSGYRIRRAGTIVGTSTTSPFVVTGLNNNQSYTHTIEAFDGFGNTSGTASVTATPVDTVAPVMSSLSAGAIGETTAEINFLDAAATDVVNYRVSQFSNFATFETITDNNSSSYSYTFNGLASGTTYTFYARAVDDDGLISTSQSVIVITIATPPDIPSGLAVTADDNILNYTWNANSESDLSGYKIRQSPAGTPQNTATNNYSVTELTNNVQACYQVAAYDIWGNTSAYSTPVCGTPVDNVIPDAPSLTAIAGNLSVTLNWTSPTAADASFFRIYEFSGGTYTLIEFTSNISTTNKTYPVAYSVSKSYAVSTVDDDGNESLKSTIASATSQDNIPPTPPTSLSATAGDQFVYLSWTAATDNNVVSGYQVIYKIVDETGETIATTTATNYTASGLTNNETYNFTVQAYDPAGNLSTAATINATPTDNTAPDMKSLILDTKTETQITVTFDESNATDTDYYTITRDNFATSNVIDETNAGSYNYTFSNLSGNTAYTLKIKATDDDGNESIVRSLSVTTAAEPPATPAGLSVTELDNKLTYTWNANSEADFAGYKLYRVSTGALIATTTATTADVTGLTNGVQVCYQVAAYDIWNNLSGKSTAVCGTPIDLVPPFDVTNLTNTASTEYSYTISWTDSSSPDVDYYKIYKDSFYLDDVNDVPGQTTYTYTATGLTPGVSYVFTVNPVDDDGLETFAGTSGTISGVTTGVPPNAPTGFSGTPGTDKIYFSWNASTDPDLAGYKLYRVNGTSYDLVNTYLKPTTSAELATSVPTARSYVLAAYDTGGTISGYSSPVTVAPISSAAPLFAGKTSPVGASDIVESSFGLFGILTPILLIILAIWFVAKMIPTVKYASNGKNETNMPNETQPERVKKTKRTKQEIETDRRIKREISEEKRRIEKVKSNVRKKLSATLGYRIYKKD